MKKDRIQTLPYERIMTEAEFMESFNQNMPDGYPHVTLEILARFRAAHPSLFTDKNAWSLDRHRKRMIEWLPHNIQAE